MRKLHTIDKTLVKGVLAAFTALFQEESWFDANKHLAFSVSLLPEKAGINTVSEGEFSHPDRQNLTRGIAEEKARRAGSNFADSGNISTFKGRNPEMNLWGGGLFYAEEHNEGFVESFGLAVSGLTEEMDEAVGLALAQLHLPNSKLFTYYESFIKRDAQYREGLIDSALVLKNADALRKRVTLKRAA